MWQNLGMSVKFQAKTTEPSGFALLTVTKSVCEENRCAGRINFSHVITGGAGVASSGLDCSSMDIFGEKIY